MLKPVLFLCNPEWVHEIFVWCGECLGRSPLTRYMISLLYGYPQNDKRIVVDGLTYHTPVLLSAGFDYDARLTHILPSMSFGGAEVGSVTAKPYGGNTRPRLTRLKQSKSILVNKGLKNQGVESIIRRLKKRKKIQEDFVIGVSIAKTNCKETATTGEAIEDYAFSLRRLTEENVGDYYTINISCPNAFGGETFTTPDLLQKLLGVLGEIAHNKPVYIKMPINLAWDKFQELLDVIGTYSYVNGVVIGNLNKNYDDLEKREEAPREYRGGLSGLPTKKLSTELIRKTRQKMGPKFTIIGCGGILSVEDAQEKIDAGADLLQLITGMIYTGPHLMKDIVTALEYSEKYEK